MHHPLRRIVVWSLLILFGGGACGEGLTEPTIDDCSLLSIHVLDTEIVRPWQDGPWLNTVLTNNGSSPKTLDWVSVTLKGQAIMYNTRLNAPRQPTVSSLFITNMIVTRSYPRTLVMDAARSPIVVEPDEAEFIQLSASFDSNFWEPGFTITVNEVHTVDGCSITGLPQIYHVPLGPPEGKG